MYIILRSLLSQCCDFSYIHVCCECYCDHRELHVRTHAFPTRRSSDLLEARGLGLFGGRRAGAERDRDFTHAAVAHVLRMGVALAAVADDGEDRKSVV